MTRSFQALFRYVIPAPVLALGGALWLSGCAEEEIPVGPDFEDQFSALPLQADAPVCEVIDFNEFQEGEQISSLSLFGFTVGVTVVPVGTGSTNQLRAYDTDPPVGADPDLESAALCPNCAGLDKVAIIQE